MRQRQLTWEHESRGAAPGARSDREKHQLGKYSSKRQNDTDDRRINERIRGVTECLLIGSDGEKIGVTKFGDALDMAYDEGLDLVEIAPQAVPPVCRIMSYSKYRYEQQRKAREQRKNQSAKGDLKQMKFRCNIDSGDYETKRKHIVRFIDGGNKVRVTIMFRGRELSHPEQGLNLLNRLIDDLADVATVTKKPTLEGRDMSMTIVPKA